MGGDGQALTNNRSLLNKIKQYAVTVEDDNVECRPEKEIRSERWKHCALSFEPLEFPAAFDLGGDVYSKLSVVDFLIARKSGDRTEGEASTHLKKLSDICEITNESSDEGIKCPVTGYLTSSGVHSFVGFWGCGHVVSLSVIPKETGKEEVACPACGANSVIVKLILSKEEGKAQRERLRVLVRCSRKRSRE